MPSLGLTSSGTLCHRLQRWGCGLAWRTSPFIEGAEGAWAGFSHLKRDLSRNPSSILCQFPHHELGGSEHKAAGVALAPGAAWWPPRASPGATNEERACDSGLWDSLQEGTGDRFHTDWPDFITESLCSSWFPFLSLLPCPKALCCASHTCVLGAALLPSRGSSWVQVLGGSGCQIRAGLGCTGTPGLQALAAPANLSATFQHQAAATPAASQEHHQD